MTRSSETNDAVLGAELARIASRDDTIGIMGMRYVGLPLALTALKAGFQVIGFDIDEARVALLNRDESGIKHIPSGAIAEALAEKRFRATSDLSLVSLTPYSLPFQRLFPGNENLI